MCQQDFLEWRVAENGENVADSVGNVGGKVGGVVEGVEGGGCWMVDAHLVCWDGWMGGFE